MQDMTNTDSHHDRPIKGDFFDYQSPLIEGGRSKTFMSFFHF